MIAPQRLLLFEAVVAAGTFSGAAERLHLSQPSVSRQIAALERECGARLLERGRRRVELTPAGAALLERARAVRAELVAADASMRAFAGAEAGRVRVVAFPTAAAAIAAPALGRLRRSHPGAEVALHQAPPERALDRLRAGEADVALVFDTEEAPLATGGLRRLELLEEPFVAALPGDHALAGAAPLRLRRLRGERWIVGTPADRPGAIERACLAAAFQPEVVARADDQPTIQALVAAGVAVTLIPRLATTGARSDVALVPLRDAPARRIAAVTLDAQPRNPVAEAFLAHAADVALGRRGPGGPRRPE